MGGEKLWYAVLLIRSWRITPAWAGKRMSFFASSELDKDHPRVGGEKFSTVFVGFLLPGSPPRGRGKVEDMRKAGLNPRITPAWAGKSRRHAESRTKSKDHPRVGGEKLKQRMCSTAIAGSPPRGRGKDKLNVREDFAPGITPAWAGKSHPEKQPNPGCRDHPRVGGEKSIQEEEEKSELGSPPRGRGKVSSSGWSRTFHGITPAWAGKSSYTSVWEELLKDHPRVGGEKQVPETHVSRTRGSPPRGRGKAATDFFSVLRPRITPAWAGKRLKRSHRSGIFISGPIPFHSVLHRPAGSGGSRAGRDGSPAGQPQNTGPA